MNHRNNDKEIIDALNILKDERAARPPEAVLRSILEKLPEKSALKSSASIKSPYSSFQRIAVTSLAVMALVFGGTLIHHHSGPVPTPGSQIAPGDASDTSLDQGLSTIDSQLGSLDTDSADADKALTL